MNLKDSTAAPNAIPAALALAFERQRRARDAGPAPSRSERAAALDALEALLRDNTRALCDAVDRDFQGRAPQETRLLEIFPALESIRHARRNLARWMKPQRRPTNFWFLPGRSRVVFQPLGVAGIVVPWNYPIYLALGPLVGAVAAGNRALVKMSEAAPATGELLATLVAGAFAPESIAVVNGGPEVARAFVSLPFDHLLFTGSTAVGREVMRAAAAHLTPVTLELGGKSPAIVGRASGIAEAAERIAFGKCLNAGQTCIAPDYALVPEERVEDFGRAVAAAIARLYPRLADNRDYSAIVNERHRARLRAYLDEARAQGARVEEINPAGEDFSGSAKMAPHLVFGAGDSLALMRDALYVFDHDRASIERVIAETVSGGVTVNETILHIAQDELPFGGVGPSGMGEYHGRAGFEAFSKRKAIFYQPRLNALKLFRPPYGERFERLLRLLTR